MTRLDWERAKRQRDVRRAIAFNAEREARVRREMRQRAMVEFVEANALTCFRCKRRNVPGVVWAKTGRRKSGRPWAICVECVARSTYKRVPRSA